LKRELGIRAREAGQERPGGRAPLIKDKISRLTDPDNVEERPSVENAAKRAPEVLDAKRPRGTQRRSRRIAREFGDLRPAAASKGARNSKGNPRIPSNEFAATLGHCFID